MGVIWAYWVISVNLLFRFYTDRTFEISIHDSVGVNIYAFSSSLSGVEGLFDNFQCFNFQIFRGQNFYHDLTP